MMRDYIAPSLDTTISAGFIAYLFARNPTRDRAHSLTLSRTPSRRWYGLRRR